MSSRGSSSESDQNSSVDAGAVSPSGSEVATVGELVNDVFGLAAEAYYSDMAPAAGAYGAVT